MFKCADIQCVDALFSGFEGMECWTGKLNKTTGVINTFDN